MRFSCVSTMDDLSCLIEEIGILPFFPNSISGWSLEENIHPDVWFTDTDGPWEWKGLLAARKQCVYGKFIRNKAAFVSPSFFCHLANVRRDALPFEDRAALGLIPHREQQIYDCLSRFPGIRSRTLRQQCGVSKGFDAAITHLQMATYVVIQSTAYDISKDGHPYGWGNSVFITADAWLGNALESGMDQQSPEESQRILLAHLISCMPDVAEDALLRELHFSQ